VFEAVEDANKDEVCVGFRFNTGCELPIEESEGLRDGDRTGVAGTKDDSPGESVAS
jgi:hypothetical protein